VLDAALAEARRLCGLDFDLAGFYRSARGDRVLAGLTAQLPGLRPTLMPQPLEMLIGSICAQQVNLPWAFTVRSRLVRRYGTPVRVGGATVYAFPEAEVLARATVDELRGLQFTTRKAEYIAELGRLVAAGALDLHGLAGRANEDVIAALTEVRGLGRWTAEWFLARGLGRGDVCPAGDLGVRRAVGHFYGRGGDASERAVRRRAARWGAHQNLAVHYLLVGQRLEEAMRREGAR
jgi:DNA-3-methyladenine glycosylase II